ncbi:MAG: helix-turn-helix transcriptional regulator [Streptomyces sp.]|nr:helix-turn-helix transcriptional regulator [Streptomyces sp.]
MASRRPPTSRTLRGPATAARRSSRSRRRYCPVHRRDHWRPTRGSVHGLTQAELAERAGLTQAEVSRIEGSDTVPTLPLPAKLAEALDAALNPALDDSGTRVTFTAHRQDVA